MIFVFDVGNTNTVLGVYEEDELKYHWRIETNRGKTADEYAMTIKALFEHEDLPFSSNKRDYYFIGCSPIMLALESMCEKYFHTTPFIVGPGVKTGLNIKYDNPREVGADRIVNAVAGINEYGSPLIIVDFGTATTYCYINEEQTLYGWSDCTGYWYFNGSLI